MVNYIIISHNQLWHSHERISFLLQAIYNALQSIGCILWAVMHKDNSTIIKGFMIHNCIDNALCTIIFPVQAIAIRYKSKDNYFGVFSSNYFYVFQRKRYCLIETVSFYLLVKQIEFYAFNRVYLTIIPPDQNTFYPKFNLHNFILSYL